MLCNTRATIATSSRRLVRGYAAGQNPHLVVPSDSRTDVIRQTLYPADAPGSSSPTGVHHPQHAERIAHVVQNAEAHETIERAWLLFQRERRNIQRSQLDAKYRSMVDACNQLDQITADTPQRAIYDRAMAKPSPVQIKGKGPEARWLEARIEGLVPREAWVPTETRGKGWNYDWKRPAQKN